jgi:hypothetical protein
MTEDAFGYIDEEEKDKMNIDNFSVSGDERTSYFDNKKDEKRLVQRIKLMKGDLIKEIKERI